MQTPPAPPSSDPAPRRARRWPLLVVGGLLLFLAGLSVGFHAGQSAASGDGKGRNIVSSAFAVFGIAHNHVVVDAPDRKPAPKDRAD
jgi:hypothetical protein